MTEILTESFCERCGTRYTFESAAPRRSRLGRVRTVSKGVKNFVLSDETTLSEAMADARSDEERSATASQLDAFHRTFNFCLTCRQYTCGNCWNTAEGRCLTCMPLPGMDQADPLMAVPPIAFVEQTNGVHDHEHDLDEAAEPVGAGAWPEADVGVERLDRVLGTAAVADAAELDELDELPPADAAVTRDEAVVFEPESADEAMAAQAPEEAEAELPFELDEDAIVARISGVAPGQTVEDAVAEYEAQVAAEEAQRARTAELAAAPLAAQVIDQPSEPMVEAESVVEPEAVAEPVEAVGEAEAVSEPVDSLAEAEAVPEQVEAVAEPEPEAGEAVAEREPELEAVAAEPVAVAEPEPEAVEAVAEAEPEPEAVAAEPAAVAAEADAHDVDLIEVAAAAAVVSGPEPVAAGPEPVAAESEDEHHGLAAAAALAGAATMPHLQAPTREPEPVEAAAHDDVVAQPTWPVTPAAAPPPPPPVPAPAQPGAPAQPEAPAQPAASPWLTVAPDEGSQPQWPAAPIWGQPAAGRGGVPATLAGHALLPQDDAAAMWAESAREVLNGTAKAPQPVAAVNLTPQPCVSCGLSLSANARFCRRCGTRQG
jgi:hypothetical protein